MSMPDIDLALIEYLRADSDVAALTEGRVYGAEIPEAQAASMPRPAVVVREAGGAALGAEWQHYTDIRFDVFAYGATPKQASQLARAVHLRLKHLTRTVSATAVLHWAKPEGGPIALRDPDTSWPFVWSSWQVLVLEVVAA